LGALREARFRTVLRLMYHCGLRVGETVGIEVRDIHGKETRRVCTSATAKAARTVTCPSPRR